ncbi:MAG: hypothetical protein QXY45_00955 [Candidatus Aenigmatarchaeota archaeon]
MNIVNRSLILILIILILHPAIAKIELQNVYSIYVEVFRNDSVNPISVGTVRGTISHFSSQQKDYSVKVLGPRDKILFERYLEIPFVIYLEPEGSLNLESNLIQLRVPYSEEATRIRLYHLGKIILDIDLSQLCNKNSVCDIGENKYNCPEDCYKREFSWGVYILLIAALILVLVFLKLRKTKK